MSEALRLQSPAKVNLRLEILKKRDDGYHEIRTVFQKISLHDTLYFSLRKRKGFRSRQTIPICRLGKPTWSTGPGTLSFKEPLTGADSMSTFTRGFPLVRAWEVEAVMPLPP